MRTTCTVEMLPTEKENWFTTPIFKDNTEDKIYNSNEASYSQFHYTAQFLYIISSNEVIKKGDNVLHLGSRGDIYFANTGKSNTFIDKVVDIKNGVAVCERFEFGLVDGKPHPISGVSKIMSSMDKSLGLPRPQDSFIKAYIKSYNDKDIITEVELNVVLDTYTHTEGDVTKTYHYKDIYVAESRTDGSSIIHQSKKFSKKEMLEKLAEFGTHVAKELGHEINIVGELKNWAESNIN